MFSLTRKKKLFKSLKIYWPFHLQHSTAAIAFKAHCLFLDSVNTSKKDISRNLFIAEFYKADSMNYCLDFKKDPNDLFIDIQDDETINLECEIDHYLEQGGNKFQIKEKVFDYGPQQQKNILYALDDEITVKNQINSKKINGLSKKSKSIKSNPYIFVTKNSFVSKKEESIINKALEIHKNSPFFFEKKEYFYEINALDISQNALQKVRFQTTSSGKFLLFENSKRQKILLDMLTYLEKEEVFLTGPIGVGKSHCLAFLTLYLKGKIKSMAIPQWINLSKTRVFYINNPEQYYYKSFRDSIIPDLIDFMGDDLESASFASIKEKFYNLNFNDENEVLAFIVQLLKSYEKMGYLTIMILDQTNVLDRSPLSGITLFIKKLQDYFPHSIRCASNTNFTMNQSKILGKEIKISSKDFFENESDFEGFIKGLGYFEKHSDKTFLNEVAEITGKNPYEIMILDECYRQTKWNSLEDLKKNYLERKFINIEESHVKFMQEYCKTELKKDLFLRFICFLDQGIKPELIESYTNLINLSLIEIDQKMNLHSICPAVKLFYDNLYKVNENLTMNERTVLRANYKRAFDENPNGAAFQKIVDFWLINHALKVIKVTRKDKPDAISIREENHECHIFNVWGLKEILEDEEKFKELVIQFRNILIIVRDKNFDLIDHIMINCENKKGYSMILMNATIQKDLKSKVANIVSGMDVIMAAKLASDEAQDKDIIQDKAKGMNYLKKLQILNLMRLFEKTVNKVQYKFLFLGITDNVSFPDNYGGKTHRTYEIMFANVTKQQGWEI